MVLDFNPEDDCDDQLGKEHLDARFEEEEATANFVDGVDGDHGGDDVHRPRYGRGVEGRVVFEAERVEEDRGVEHDRVDAGELLEDLLQEIDFL